MLPSASDEVTAAAAKSTGRVYSEQKTRYFGLPPPESGGTYRGMRMTFFPLR